MKHRTAELTGRLLDEAVFCAEGLAATRNSIIKMTNFGSGRGGALVSNNVPAYSSDWAHGGAIIERELIELTNTENGWYAAVNPWAYYRKSVIVAEAPDGEAETPLVAAMRAFVSAKLGAEVDL